MLKKTLNYREDLIIAQEKIVFGDLD